MADLTTHPLKTKFEALKPLMDEQLRRLWAATEARALGRGGITRVAHATGLSPGTLRAGLKDLEGGITDAAQAKQSRRVRRPGGARPRLTVHDLSLLGALEALVDPLTRGDPPSPLRGRCKSAANLAAPLQAQGHQVSARPVITLLHTLGYSLPANRQLKEGRPHPDRNAQFQYLNRLTKVFQRWGQPVVSVDTKKKERVGEFNNGGQEWQPLGHPESVRGYDFVDPEVGNAIPYGVYALTANPGWVSVGVDQASAAFAVEPRRRWGQPMGRLSSPKATRWLSTAEGGGANGSRWGLWTVQWQDWAEASGRTISVCHFPPGTSKWNKIEHRMFCHITENWRGRPLISHEGVVKLIGSTTTQAGLTIRAVLDDNRYPTGQKVTDQQLNSLTLKKHRFHGEWNYTLLPRTQIR